MDLFFPLRNSHHQLMAKKRAPKRKQRVISPTEESTPTLLPHLPQELIEEILLRLPVKSLLGFKCVCKSWNTLISDPQFAKKHFHITLMNEDYNRGVRLIRSCDETRLKSCTADLLLSGISPFEIGIGYPMESRDSEVMVLAQCQGLLFVNVDDMFYIWNPCTREYKMLPSEFSRDMDFMDFHYHESSDDYKLLLCSEDSTIPPQIRVFSLKTNSWRTVENVPSYIPLEEPCVHLDGVFLWLTYHFEGGKKLWRIVSFDLAKETFQEIPQPKYGHDDIKPSICARDGCLYVISEGRGSNPDVWIMEEDGVKESWTKLVSVPYEPANSDENSMTLCELENGKVLMKHDRRLFIYDAEISTMYPSIADYLGDDSEGEIFVESLISPGPASERGHYSLRGWEMGYNEFFYTFIFPFSEEMQEAKKMLGLIFNVMASMLPSWLRQH